MNQSSAWCGKDCSACAQRAALSCPGCLNGPGMAGPEECNIARCRRERITQRSIADARMGTAEPPRLFRKSADIGFRRNPDHLNAVMQRFGDAAGVFPDRTR